MILLLADFNSLVPKKLLEFDYWLFTKINQTWTNPFFDLALPFIRQQEFWYFFYLFLLVFAMLNFGKRGCLWAFMLLMTAVISDLISSGLIKHAIDRVRPCGDPGLAEQVRILVNYCPQNSSFTSSHACNHFAAAWFIFITLKETGSWRWLLLVWAFVISYAQVYVGVHFPIDILGGAIIGSLIGYGMSIFFKKQFGILY